MLWASPLMGLSCILPAELRGSKVIMRIDGISAELLYLEQYTVWHLKNALRVSAQVNLTRTDLLEY